MNAREKAEKESRDLCILLEKIEREIDRGTANEDGDLVIPQEAAERIEMLRSL